MNRIIRDLTISKFFSVLIAAFLLGFTASAQVSITCPANIAVGNDPGECAALVNYTPPVGTGSGTGITTTLTAGLPPGSSFDVGTSQVTYTVTNNEGDTESCSFLITVYDTEIPVIDCPADIVVDADPVTCEAVVNFDIPQAVDNCGLYSVFQFGGLPSGSSFPVGESFVDFQAVDINSNSAYCRFKIIVNDVSVPTITCPDDMTFLVYNSCDTVINYTAPVGTDACSAANTVLTSGNGSGGTFSVGSTTETYTVTDIYGNSVSCSFAIHIVDAAPPVISCPGNIVVNADPGDCEAIVTFADATATDNCSGVSVVQSSGQPSGSAFPTGVSTVGFTASDASGNGSTCSFTVTVLENEHPEIACIDGITVDNDPGECGAIVNYTAPEGTDNCPGATTSLTSGIGSGNMFPVGVSTETYTVADASGNTTSCSFQIEVVDVEAPQINCPPDISAVADPGTCGTVVSYDAPVATDNCTIASISLIAGLASGSIFPSGETTVTYEAADVAGNTSTCSFVVTVEDTENPEITCPADLVKTVSPGFCSTVVYFAPPTATDNCAVSSIDQIGGLASGADFPVGINLITYVASDQSGNTDTCSFTITVLEPTPPEITCPVDISVPADEGICGAVVTYVEPIGTDGCPGVTTEQTSGLGSGSEFPIGTSTETYTVTDASGNTVSCSFTITVTDNQLPVITCPDDITIEAETGLCSAVVNYTTPTVTDNCDDAIVPVLTSGLNSGDAFPVGINTVEYSATDPSGNISTCFFTVTVTDTVAPSIACPGDIVMDAASGNCDVVVNYPDPVILDNCPGSTLTLIEGNVSGSSFPVGETTVTYQAEDPSGNTAECSFTVTVNEDTPPLIDCPADIIVDNDPGQCGAIVNYTAPVGTDDCSDATTELIAGFAPDSLFPVGTTIVTYEVTDFSGNQTSCSFSVTVIDTEPPAFDCSENDTLEVSGGLCGITYDFELPDATDNCTDNLVVTQSAGPATGSILGLGDTQFEFTTTDDAGNTNSCAYTITVVDPVAPVFISCPPDTIIAVDANSCEALILFDLPLATDNCDFAIEQTAGPDNNTMQGPGSYSFEYTATDNSNISSVCAFTITVVDTIAPIIQCADSIETCSNTPEFEIPDATDNCTIAEVVQTSGPESGTQFPEGATIVEFTATDISGNSTTCQLVITVLPNAPRPDLGPDQNVCDGSTFTLIGSNPEGAISLWTQIEGAGTILNPNSETTEVNDLAEGENTFVYSLDPENGCDINSDTISVFVEAEVHVDAGSDVSILRGGNTQLNALVSPEDGEFEWQPGTGLSCVVCSNPVASPIETTIYYITYTSPLGCSATDSLTVNVSFELPNTITPDGDGVNDVWNIPGIADYPNVVVIIYNRWGTEVFSSTGYNKPWDGMYKGKALPTASYYYLIDYKTPGKDNLNGTVNIIR